MAENKFKSLVQSGEWNAPSKEQTEILALTAKQESITNKKKSENKKFKEKFECKKEAPNDVMDTKDRNGKTYHWCTKHKMCKPHKARDCKLENPKEDNTNKKKKEINYN